MFNVPGQFAGSLPFGMFSSQEAPFGLATLQADPNCVTIQDPSQVWGVQDFLPRRNLLLATDTLATQNVTVVATAYKLYMQGTGSITLSGTGSGTLNGTGANDRVSLSFTPTAGTLTLTVSGTVTYGMLCRSDTIDQSYQKITDWTTEQYAWAAQKQVPWLRRNAVVRTEDITTSDWTKSGTTATAVNIIQCTASSSSHELKETTGTITPVIGNTYYISCQAKPGTWGYFQLSSTSTLNGSSYANFNVSNGTIGNYASCTPSISGPDSDGYYTISIAVVATAGASPTVFSSSIRESLTDSRYYVWTAAGTETVYVRNFGLYAGSLPAYQPIGASWDATYTASAIAAGYPISIWQDSAGTTAVTGDNQPIGKMLNYKLNGLYDATKATTANQPKWRLDANGKPYIERDLVNDALPITLPNLGSNCVIYTAEGNVTLKDSGITLNGSYAPLTPAADYGRIIMAAGSQYDAKIIKYLDGKRGRAYNLGPELVANGGFTTDTAGWTVNDGGVVISAENGKLKVVTGATSSRGAIYGIDVVSGKTYILNSLMRSSGAVSISIRIIKNPGGTFSGQTLDTTSAVEVAGNCYFTAESGSTYQVYARIAGSNTTAYFDNISVREVLL